MDGENSISGTKAEVEARIAQARPKCQWVEEGEYWSASCGLDFVLISGTPEENEMVYCPSCGRQIEEVH